MKNIHALEKKFLDHFDDNIMEYPKSIWRKAWGWKPLYWLRCHTFTKYHIIDIRDAEYRWGWIDRDHAMVLACFKLLCEYVELEKPFDHINWDSDEAHRTAAAEITFLYTWWKNERKREQDKRDAMWNEIYEWGQALKKPGEGWLGPIHEHPNYDEYTKYSEWVDGRDDEMLARLVKIRGYLWT